MIICPRCGFQNPDGIVQCQRCGQPFMNQPQNYAQQNSPYTNQNNGYPNGQSQPFQNRTQMTFSAASYQKMNPVPPAMQPAFYQPAMSQPTGRWVTGKLISGIFSIIFSLIIFFQSFIVGISNTLENSGESSGSAGAFLGIIFLASGIIGIATRKGKGGGITAGILYLIAGLIGISNVGSYGDLQIWSILSFIFAGIFLIGSFLVKNPKK